MATSSNGPVAQSRYDFADFAIALVSGVALAVTAIFLCSIPFSGHMAGSRDFVAYYATGQQLAHHANPYDWQDMMRLEKSAGLVADGVLLMRNPPWSLPLAYPLGFLGLRVAATLWSIVLLSCLLVSVHLVRVLHGSPPNYIHWLGLAFTPALICLTMGQTALFALLGLVLFLRFHRTHPFNAGLSLWLCALKPHLFLPFGVALIAWILVSRSYRILAGTLAALGASSAIAYCIDPQAWTLYLAMMRSPKVQDEFIPCLSDALRFLAGSQLHWLQFLPVSLSCIWAFFYFWSRRQTWDWIENGSPLMLVSIVAAPYCFIPDQSLVVPALLHGAYSTRSRALLVVLTAALVLIDLEICRVKIVSYLYLWPAPVWFAWYLFAHAYQNAAAARPEPSAAHT